MRQLLFFSDGTWCGLILRLTAGLIMLPHGAQKMLGLFGGYGFSATVNFFTAKMKLPLVVAVLIILIEFFCSLFLIAGFATRLSGICILIIMLGAIITTNLQNGFFMNWFGNQTGEGYEYHLLFIGLCIALVFTGGGKYSLDNLLKAEAFR